MSKSDYVKAHKRLRRIYGDAFRYPCSECPCSAQEWAYLYLSPEPLMTSSGTPYTHNPFDYQPMCIKCHDVFDRRMDPRLADLVSRRAKACGEGVKRHVAARGNGVFVAAGKKAAARRRKCGECDLVRSPAVTDGHQRTSGHSGWVDLM